MLWGASKQKFADRVLLTIKRVWLTMVYMCFYAHFVLMCAIHGTCMYLSKFHFTEVMYKLLHIILLEKLDHFIPASMQI